MGDIKSSPNCLLEAPSSAAIVFNTNAEDGVESSELSTSPK